MFSLCSDQDKLNGMSQSQNKALDERELASIDIEQRTSKIIDVVQTGNIKKFNDHNMSALIDSLAIQLPDGFGGLNLIESVNYYIFNNVLLQQNENIIKYTKKGIFISSFGMKGRGPNEVTKIESIGSDGGKVFVSDNGDTKIFNENDSLIKTHNLKTWAYGMQINSNDYDLKSAANKVFPFPIYNYSIETGNLNFCIKDIRQDVFNYKSPNAFEFTSNDTILFYTKSAENVIYLFNKQRKQFLCDFVLKSEIIRTNSYSLPENASRTDFTRLLENIFLIKQIYYDGINVWILFKDRREGKTSLYLGAFELETEKGEIELSVFDVSFIAQKSILHSAKFFSNKLYWHNEFEKSEIMIYSINLKEFRK